MTVLVGKLLLHANSPHCVNGQLIYGSQMSLFTAVVYLTALPFDGLIDVTIFQHWVSSRATASQAESLCYPSPDNFPSPQTTFSYFQTWFTGKHVSLSK